MIISLSHIAFTGMDSELLNLSLKEFSYNVLFQEKSLNNINAKKDIWINTSDTHDLTLYQSPNYTNIELLHNANSAASSNVESNLNLVTFLKENISSPVQRSLSIALQVDDIESEIQFWGQLGFIRTNVTNTHVILRRTELISKKTTNLELSTIKGIKPLDNTIGFSHICFNVTKLESEIIKLSKYDIYTSSPEYLKVQNQNLYISFVKSPCGIPVELFEIKRSNK